MSGLGEHGLSRNIGELRTPDAEMTFVSHALPDIFTLSIQCSFFAACPKTCLCAKKQTSEAILRRSKAKIPIFRCADKARHVRLRFALFCGASSLLAVNDSPEIDHHLDNETESCSRQLPFLTCNGFNQRLRSTASHNRNNEQGLVDQARPAASSGLSRRVRES
jgi:hypothetical protein